MLVDAPCEKPRLPNSLCNQMTSFVTVARTIYSASVVELEQHGCFHDPQATSPPIHEQNKTSSWSMIIKINYIINIIVCCQNVNSCISSETNTKAWSGFQVFQILWITLKWIFLGVEENLVAIETTYVMSRWVPILANCNSPTISL
jgi:hypothetical protein